MHNPCFIFHQMPFILFFSVQIISSCLSHELKFKYPPESVEVQDIMEVKLSANKHSILYLPLARMQNVTTVWLRQPKGVDVLLLSCAWCVWCLCYRHYFFWSIVLTERIQSEYGELHTTYTVGERKNMVIYISDKEPSMDLSS